MLTYTYVCAPVVGNIVADLAAVVLWRASFDGRGILAGNAQASAASSALELVLVVFLHVFGAKGHALFHFGVSTLQTGLIHMLSM